MSEGLTRRDFLKSLGVSLGALILPNRFTLQAPERETKVNVFPGDYYPEDTQARINENEKVPSALPEKEIKDRVWNKIEIQEKPPSGYRQAAVWSRERGSFIIHGGRGENGASNETWEFKNNLWTKLEEGSTPKLSGHKVVETPLGLLMFGGVEDLGSGNYQVVNKGYLFSGGEVKYEWKEINFNATGDVPEVRQGAGMVYDAKNSLIWLIGGASQVGITGSIACIEPPEEGQNYWTYKKVYQYSEFGAIPPLFEPLAFVGEEDQVTIFGGLRDYGSSRINSSDPYEISWHLSSYNQIVADIVKPNWPNVDYAGPVRGGFDLKKKQIILNGGTTPVFFQTNWSESVVFDKKDKWWGTIPSANGPSYVDKSAATVNPETGELFRFGGVSYKNGQPIFSNETWVLEPRIYNYLPLVNKN